MHTKVATMMKSGSPCKRLPMQALGSSGCTPNPQFGMPQQFGSYRMAHFRPPTEAVMQQSIEGHEGGCTSSIGKKQVKVKQSNFSADEDVHLTKWWVAVSTDPVINMGQRREGF